MLKVLPPIRNGQQNVCFRVEIEDSSVTTNVGLTGLSSSSSGLLISVSFDNSASVTTYKQASSSITAITTAGTYSDPGSDAGFVQIDPTNQPGIYELQFTNSLLRAPGANWMMICIFGAANCKQMKYVVPLNNDAVFTSTVKSSPAPTTTTFTLNDSPGLGDNLTDTLCVIYDSVTMSRRVASLGGFSRTNVAVSPALPQAPTTGVQVCFYPAGQVDVGAVLGVAAPPVGVPAGASVMADVAAVKADTLQIRSDVEQLSFLDTVASVTSTSQFTLTSCISGTNVYRGWFVFDELTTTVGLRGVARNHRTGWFGSSSSTLHFPRRSSLVTWGGLSEIRAAYKDAG